uniref:Clathrin assembly protein complex 1 medium chain n=1 Tax=Stygiella incarcerata TaxID=1712417 RepID=A0A192ZHU1_9EUKA|nr:clathrin assembly protein complex 1 medium chain [Stygiella incarcerata]
MVVSSIFFLDVRGRIILTRNYRADIPISCVEKFRKIVVEEMFEDEETFPRPVFMAGGITYVYIQYKNIYVLAVTKQNANATAILSFLHRLVSVFREYLKEVEEESIRDNFVIVYELLDEMMDYGYPQFTETQVLQEYITQECHRLEIEEVRPPLTVTNAVSWRSEGISYKKDEVFLDVVESLNVLMSSTGSLLRSEINGTLLMRCHLSGMPELKLGLNDRVLFENMGRSAARTKSVELEDVKFHHCVRLSRFETERTISFIPPDGDFELMSYRLNTRVKPVIWVEMKTLRHEGSRVEYSVKAKANFKPRSTANKVQIEVPVPQDVDTPRFKTTNGGAKYVPERNVFVWYIKSFPGGSEFLLRASFGLPSLGGKSAVSLPPISVHFEIPYFTVSGLKVRYLKIIEKSGISALPWVRYITQSGDFSIRVGGV